MSASRHGHRRHSGKARQAQQHSGCTGHFLEELESKLLLTAAPVLTTISTLTGATEDAAFSIPYATLFSASNATDSNGQPVSFQIQAVSTGTLTEGGSPVSPGTTLITTADTVVWTPAANANGTGASALSAFTVKAYDGAQASATAVQVKVAVVSDFDAPTLTHVNTLTGALEDHQFTITYIALAAAGNQADLDSSTINFRIMAVSSGTLTKNGVTVPSNGTITLAAGQTLAWMPASHANGLLNAFTVEADDGTSLSGTPDVQVNVNVAAYNYPPVVNSTAALIGGTENTPYTISYATLLDATGATDVENETLSFKVAAVSTGMLTKGSLPVVAGTTTVGVGESLVWTPAANAHGTLNAFTIKANDGAVDSTTASQVTVAVAQVPQPPTLTTVSNLTGATQETPFSITYAALTAASNKTDVDGNPVSFRIEQVSSGTLTKGGAAVTPHTTTIGVGDTVVWTPAMNASGTLEAFRILASDGVSLSATPVPVNVVVAHVNHAPRLTSVAPLTGALENTAYTIPFATLAAASDAYDVDGDTLKFVIAAVSTGTLTKGTAGVVAGTTTVGAGESLTWTPASNANGLLNAFTVKVKDAALTSSTAVQVKIFVGHVNQPPLLTAIRTLTGATEDTPFTITYAALNGAATASDADGDPISYRVDTISSGTLMKNGRHVMPGVTTIATGESLVWTPAFHAFGATTSPLNAFTVKAYDGVDASATAIQVKVVVANTPHAPTLTTIAPLTGAVEDAPFTISYVALAAAGNQSDPDGTTPSFRVDSVSSGTLKKNGVAVVPGVTTLGTGESLIWTPPLHANGTGANALNAFMVKAWDGALASATAVQVKVATSAVNHAPTLTTVSTLTGAYEDTAYLIPYAALLGASDLADVDGPSLNFRIQAVTTGTLTKNGAAVVPGTTVLSVGQSLVWTPAAHASGTGASALNAFTVVGYDSLLTSATPVQVKVAVTQVAHAPTLTTINTLTGASENTAFSITYAALAAASNVADMNGLATSFLIIDVNSGTLTKGGVAVIPGTTTLASGQTLVWTPPLNASGTGASALTAFTVKADDGSLLSAAPVQVKVAVAGVNQVPTLTTMSTLPGALEDTPFTISYATLQAAGNAADVDSPTINYRIEAVSSGTLTKNGTAVVPGTTILSAGQSLVWTPAANAHGTGASALNAFTVKATDGTALSTTAVQVKVNVAAVDKAPTLTAVATLTGATENTAFSIPFATLAAAGNQGDIDGDTVSYLISAVSTGTLTKGGIPVLPGTSFGAGETLVWTPALNASGTGSSALNAFTVKAYDGHLSSATPVQVKVSVAHVNHAPTLTYVNTLAGATENAPYTITYAALAAAADERDIDGDHVSFSITAVAGGTLKLNNVVVVPGTTLLSTGQSLVWTPPLHAFGSGANAVPAFSIKAYDGALYSSTALPVKVNVTPVNYAPTLTTIRTLPDGTEDTAYTISYALLMVASDAADPNNDTLSFQIQTVSTGSLSKGGTAVTLGTTTLGPGESLVWTPAANANGAGANALTAFTVKAYDGSLASSTAVPVKVNVAAVDDGLPTLTSITTLAGGTEDTAYPITYAALLAASDATDPDPEQAVNFLIQAVSTGTLTKNGGAVIAGTTTLASGESLIWTPAPNANGIGASALNAFTVTPITSTEVGASTVQVKVAVAPVNDPPTLTTISTLAGGTEDTVYDITYASLLAASDMADVDTGETLSFAWAATTSGTLTQADGTTPVGAGDRLGATQTWKWTPPVLTYGTGANALSAFTVKAYDGSLSSGWPVQVKVDVANTPHAPTLTSISTLTGASENTPFGISYAALAAASNAADADGDPISFVITAVSSGTLTVDGAVAVPGTSTLTSGKWLLWTPPANTSGIGASALSAFTVKASDGTLTSASSIQVKVAVAPVNQAPTLSAITTIAGGAENSPLSITYAQLLAASDAADVDGNTISFKVDSVTTGTLTKNGSPVTLGVTTLGPTETLVWMPAANTFGTGANALDAFTVKAYDGALTSASPVQVKVDVAGVDTSPTLTSMRNLTGATEGQAFTITYAMLAAAGNQADPDGDPLSFLLTALGSGTLMLNGGAVTYGTSTVSPGDTLSWTPAAYTYGLGASALSAFTVKAFDGTMASASPVTVKVEVAPVNTAPTLTSVTTLTGATENTSYPITYAALLAASDAADLDGNVIQFQIQAVSSGTLTKNGLNMQAGITTLGPTESLVWTPAAYADGTGASALNAFTVKAFDGQATSATAVQVKVAVTPVENAPTLTTISTLAGGTQDTDYVITYAALLAASDMADVDTGYTLTFLITGVSSGSLAKGGTAVTAGTTTLGTGESLTWTPPAGTYGSGADALTAFTVKADDGTLTSASSVAVKVDVAATATAPTLTTISDLTGGVEGTTYTIRYETLANASDAADADGDTLSFAWVAMSTGTLTQADGVTAVGTGDHLAAGQVWKWRSAAGATGALNAFTVKAYDGTSLSSTAVQVKVDVTAVTQAPTLTTVSTLAGATEGTPYSITYAALSGASDAADANSSAISFRVEQVLSGTLTIGGVAVVPGTTMLSAGQSWNWTPATNVHGSAVPAFTVRAVDALGLASTNPVTVSVNVAAVNHAPTLSHVNVLAGGTEDLPYSITYAALAAASDAADVDGDAISFVISAVSSGRLTKDGVDVTAGTTTLSAGESLVWKGDPHVFGTANAFTVKVSDGTVTSSTAVQVQVNLAEAVIAPTLTAIATLPGATSGVGYTITYAALLAASDAADVNGNTLKFCIQSITSGTLTLNTPTQTGLAVTPGVTMLAAGDSLVWTPAASGSAVQAFTVTVWDGYASSNTAVQVTVNVS